MQKQDQCEGSSPYFCWRMAAVLSRALRKKWRQFKFDFSKPRAHQSLVISDL